MIADHLDIGWRRAWLLIAPHVSDPSLAALEAGLEADDGRIVQGRTTIPMDHPAMLAYPLSGACPLAYAGWMGDGEGCYTVGDASRYFARLREQAGMATTQKLTDWWDSTPRQLARRGLLEVVRKERLRRSAVGGRQGAPGG